MRYQAERELPASPPADPRRTRRFFLAGLAAGVVAMSAAGIAAVTLIESPEQVAARTAAPPRPAITAAARWLVLRDPIVLTGVIRAARTITVTAAAPYATVTVTAMPVRPGERVRPGRVIAEIDGRPVLLLRGRLPAYRDLHEGDAGPDVAQLQSDLGQLGYADFDPRGHFGPSTSLALALLYRHLGYRAPRYRPPGKRAAGTGHLPDVYLPASEVAYIPARSALVVAVEARVGTVVGNGPVLRLATGHPYVTSYLSPHQASLARRGTPAAIASARMPASASGTVTRVGTRPAAGGGFAVWVRARRSLPQRLVGARVRLTLRVAMTAGPVLAVPVTAIFAARRARPDHVVVLTPGGRRARVPVATGPAADGLIAVQSLSPGRLRPGDRVLIEAGR